jgi:hypothetical protein
MTCRLFIDEVGNADVKTREEQFLSITGIITKKRGHDLIITPEIERLKTDLFGHDPFLNPVILHRREVAEFGLRVVQILNRSRYSRNPKTGEIPGWGRKRLP